MPHNAPQSKQAQDFSADATLMSTTDTQGQIVYVSAAFVAVSGYSREQLIGQPHSIVRHPDMPSEAFADMWDTLRAGKSWTALIKNRRHDGDHFWVRTNATPVVRDGVTTGYMSVHTLPTRAEVADAEALYAQLRAGKAGRRSFHQGLIVRTGLWAWTSAFQTLSIRWRIRLSWIFASSSAMALAAAVGLAGVPLWIFVAGAVLVAVVMSMFMTAQIATPVELVRRQALAVAAGQPGENVHLNRVDEMGTILRAVNQSGLNLRSLVHDVSLQIDGMRSASRDIAQGNKDLSARTEQAASNLQETAASMEQMTSTVKSNADTSQQAVGLAGAASDAASQGGEIVGRVVGTMQAITASSKKIADIISVIDGIAFQTNILALNAAVEAARAGEQGRGFAVVAGEVRSLAQRSAEAAKEIKNLIGDSVEKVEAGAKLADDAGTAMKGIVDQVRRVTDLINEISCATREQSGGIDQVNVAVTQLDQVTQQNATLVQQSAAAAQSLMGQAGRLVESVGVFGAR